MKTGKIYEIGQVYEKGMPMFGARTYTLLSPGSPTYSFPTANRIVANDEFLCAEIGQVGTQFDGPGHIGMKVKMADGSTEDVYYNGFTGAEMYSPYGLRALGVENVKPILTRGILIDLAGYKNLPSLPARLRGDARGRARRPRPPGPRGERSPPGRRAHLPLRLGAVLDRAGEVQRRCLPGSGSRSRAGWSSARPRWWEATSRGPKSSPTPIPALAFPVHQELIMKNGIFNIENLALDELAATGPGSSSSSSPRSASRARPARPAARSRSADMSVA